MNGQIKKSHGEKFKFKVALAAIKADKSMAEMCHEFSLTAAQIYAWKKQLEERGIEVFSDKRKTTKQVGDIEKLHTIIGKLIVERDFLIRGRDY